MQPLYRVPQNVLQVLAIYNSLEQHEFGKDYKSYFKNFAKKARKERKIPKEIIGKKRTSLRRAENFLLKLYRQPPKKFPMTAFLKQPVIRTEIKQKTKIKKRLAELRKQKKSGHKKRWLAFYLNKKEKFKYSLRTFTAVLDSQMLEWLKGEYAKIPVHVLLGISEDMKLNRKKKYIPIMTGDTITQAGIGNDYIKAREKATPQLKKNMRLAKKIKVRKRRRTVYNLEEGDFNDENLVEISMLQMKPFKKRIEKIKKRTVIYFFVDVSENNYARAVALIEPLLTVGSVVLEIICFHSQLAGDDGMVLPNDRKYITRQANEIIRYYEVRPEHFRQSITFPVVCGLANYGEVLHRYSDEIMCRREKRRFVCFVGRKRNASYSKIRKDWLDDFMHLKIKHLKADGIKFIRDLRGL